MGISRQSEVWAVIMGNKAAKLFKEIDTDGSGYITASEFKRVLIKQIDRVVDEIHKLDKNGDGKISLKEFEILMKNKENAQFFQMLAAKDWKSEKQNIHSGRCYLSKQTNNVCPKLLWDMLKIIRRPRFLTNV